MSRPLIRLATVAMAAVTLTACGTDAPSTRAEKTPEPSRTASSSGSASGSEAPKPPEAICAEIVGYWAEQELRGNSGYGDYQSRGLSDSQNNILLDVVAEAKAERKKHGERAALKFAARAAQKRCDELFRNGGPSPSSGRSGGWPA